MYVLVPVGELAGIADDVVQRLRDANHIDVEVDRLRRHADRQRHVRARLRVVPRFQSASSMSADSGARITAQLERAHLHARDIDEIGDQPIHAAHLVFDDLGGARYGRCIHRILPKQRRGIANGHAAGGEARARRWRRIAGERRRTRQRRFS